MSGRASKLTVGASQELNSVLRLLPKKQKQKIQLSSTETELKRSLILDQNTYTIQLENCIHFID